MLPWAVNFTELLTRLSRIWRTRVASAVTQGGRRSSHRQLRATPLSRARGSSRLTTSSAMAGRFTAVGDSLSVPDSMVDTSRMSLTTLSRCRAESEAVCTKSRCWPLRRVSSSSLSMPRTPWKGVRISWLMLARNTLLAWLAASAWSRAVASSWLSCCRRANWRDCWRMWRTSSATNSSITPTCSPARAMSNRLWWRSCWLRSSTKRATARLAACVSSFSKGLRAVAWVCRRSSAALSLSRAFGSLNAGSASRWKPSIACSTALKPGQASSRSRRGMSLSSRMRLRKTS